MHINGTAYSAVRKWWQISGKKNAWYFALMWIPPPVINTQKMRVGIFIRYILHVIPLLLPICSLMEPAHFLQKLAFELVGNPDILREFYAKSAYYRLSSLQSFHKSAHRNEHFLRFSALFDEQFCWISALFRPKVWEVKVTW